MSSFKKTAKTLGTIWPALETGDPEAVHQARKLTRKAQAELRIASAPKRVRRAWRELRRAVAPVRDRDAAGEHLVAALTRLGVPRKEVTAFQTAWAAGRERQFSAITLPAQPGSVKRPKRWRARARRVLARDARALQQEALRVLATGDPEPWHDWRKHLKRYRYTLGLIGAAPKALLEVLEHLGRMQDAQVVAELLTRETWLPQYREALLNAEAGASRQAQAHIRAGWPALAEHLQAQTTPADDLK
ncbi:CHAD domain-containing protein [Deinococcus koreensis]|nr:CHAD domain-containing protein [Deinococcus koreensis]